MTSRSRAEHQVQAALKAVEAETGDAAEKAEMLMEIAMGLQQKPDRPDDLHAAVDLYRRAIALAPEGNALGVARIRARLATALMALPASDATPLKQALEEIETALATLTAEGSDAEIAEAEMNLGLICQSLAGQGLMPIQKAIGAYQRALRSFESAGASAAAATAAAEALARAGTPVIPVSEQRSKGLSVKGLSRPWESPSSPSTRLSSPSSCPR